MGFEVDLDETLDDPVRRLEVDKRRGAQVLDHLESQLGELVARTLLDGAEGALELDLSVVVGRRTVRVERRGWRRGGVDEHASLVEELLA